MFYSFMVMFDAETDFPFYIVSFNHDVSHIAFCTSTIFLKFKCKNIAIILNHPRFQFQDSFNGSIRRNFKQVLHILGHDCPSSLIRFKT